jgi:ABC transporter related protein
LKLSVQGIAFEYGSSQVLSDVSMDISEGEIVGILGPNGSGKTTLLRCINKALSPKSGSILIGDKDVNEMSRKEIALKVGVVPQSVNMGSQFSALDIVMMGRIPALERFESESDSDINIVKHAMEMTNVTHLAKRSMDSLSGGERQRVIIARALAQMPKILLLDEPTLHLDVNHQLEILEMIYSLSRSENLTVVMVTHDLSLAARYCDKLILMKKGKIQSSGPPEISLTSKSMRDVFSIEAELYFDERIQKYNVSMMSSLKEDI